MPLARTFTQIPDSRAFVRPYPDSRSRQFRTGSLPAVRPFRELAFLFRYIPVKERQFGPAQRVPRSGVRFPQYPGKGTPIARQRSEVPYPDGFAGRSGVLVSGNTPGQALCAIMRP